jgi:hypothetical protein
MRKAFQIVEKYFQINEKRENNYWEKAVENIFWAQRTIYIIVLNQDTIIKALCLSIFLDIKM